MSDGARGGRPSRRAHVLALLVLVGVAAVFLGPWPSGVEVTPQLLEQLRGELRPVLARHLGGEAGLDVPLLVVDAAGVEAYWKEARALRLEDDLPEDAPGPVAMAHGFYAADRDAIFVRRDGGHLYDGAFARAGRLAPTIAVTRDEIGRVLAHELVHAADAARLGGWPEASEPERSAVLGALLQGHAEAVARRACRDLGWSVGPDAEAWGEQAGLTAGLLERSSSTDTGFVTRWLLARDVGVESWVGFAEALLDRGGEELVLATLRDPPDDLRVVRHPEWVGDAAARPPRVDLEALARVALAAPSGGPLGRLDLGIATVPARWVGILPAADRTRLTRGPCRARILYAHGAGLDDAEGEGVRLRPIGMHVALVEASSDDEARALVDVVRAWCEATAGTGRELDASAVDVAGSPATLLQLVGSSRHAWELVLAHGCLVIDVASHDRDVVVRVAEAVVRAACEQDAAR